MLTQRNLIIAGLLVFIMLGGYWLLRPSPILVETAEVLEQSFKVSVEIDGRTRVHDRYVVSAPLAGRVSRTALRAGDEVKSGQKLMTIAPNISPLLNPRLREELKERIGWAEASVDEAVAMFERAKVQLSLTEAEFNRARKLKTRGVVSKAHYERAEFAFQSAKRDVTAAKTRHHAAEHALAQARAAHKRSGATGANERFPIFSPINGRVLKVMQESEASVTIGAPMIEIGDPQNLEVIADVLTNDAAQIHEGDKVYFTRWGGDKKLEGRVRRIEPSGFTKISALGVEEQRVWIIADITSPRADWATLSDGYRIDLEITIDEIEHAIVAPVGALFRRGEAWFVFVVDEGNARLSRVEIGRRSGRMVSISKGLRPNETVVVYPSTNLNDGNPVRR